MQSSSFELQRMLSIREVRRRVFPGRSERWIKDQLRAGAFGDVVKDSAGWLIPESGILEYLERNRVKAGDQIDPRCEQHRNLRQFSE